MITLKTLNNATAQEVFDQVVNHLRKQADQSLNSMGLCAYRGENGTRCAAGCLIGDDEYSPEMEGLSWFGMLNKGKRTETKHDDLILKLQKTHDGSTLPDNWEYEFRSIANEFSLVYTAP